jgi:hypothetical protein
MGTSAETTVSARSPRTSKISDNQRRRIIEALEEKTERIQGGKITQNSTNSRDLLEAVASQGWDRRMDDHVPDDNRRTSEPSTG